jgi:hypothetical protein
MVKESYIGKSWKPTKSEKDYHKPMKKNRDDEIIDWNIKVGIAFTLIIIAFLLIYIAFFK